MNIQPLKSWRATLAPTSAQPRKSELEPIRIKAPSKHYAIQTLQHAYDRKVLHIEEVRSA